MPRFIQACNFFSKIYCFIAARAFGRILCDKIHVRFGSLHAFFEIKIDVGFVDVVGGPVDLCVRVISFVAERAAATSVDVIAVTEAGFITVAGFVTVFF